ncbi:MAG: hypothetical protein AB7P21_01050 [Lautropia sp.]
MDTPLKVAMPERHRANSRASLSVRRGFILVVLAAMPFFTQLKTPNAADAGGRAIAAGTDTSHAMPAIVIHPTEPDAPRNAAARAMRVPLR